MVVRVQICRIGMLLSLAGLSLGQNSRNERHPPRNSPQQSGQHNTPRDSRPQVSPIPPRTQDRRQSAAPEPPRSQPPQESPRRGRYSGQWLEQHRGQPLEQQRRALETDPAYRRLPRETQRQYEQRLQRFNSLPPERQQQVLRRMETWERLTPQQKQDFTDIREQFRNLSPDRRRAVRGAIQTLRAMPPEARQRELQSGRFTEFSPQERDILNGATRLPLASAPQPPPSSTPGEQAQPENKSPKRYVPRPPH